MPIFDNFPYTDFHQLNLDWIIKTMKEQVQAIADDKDYIDGKVADFQQALDDFDTDYQALLSLSNTFTESATKITFSKNIEVPYLFGQASEAVETVCRVPNHDDCDDCVSVDRTHVSFWRGSQMTNRPADIPSHNNVMIMFYPISNVVGSEVDGQILVNDYNDYVYKRSYDHATSTWSSWSKMAAGEADHATAADSATTATNATNATNATTAASATLASKAGELVGNGGVTNDNANMAFQYGLRNVGVDIITANGTGLPSNSGWTGGALVITAKQTAPNGTSCRLCQLAINMNYGPSVTSFLAWRNGYSNVADPYPGDDTVNWNAWQVFTSGW